MAKLVINEYKKDNLTEDNELIIALEMNSLNIYLKLLKILEYII